MPRALVVEDDRELAGMLAQLLEGNGYTVDTAGDGHVGLHRLLTRPYDVAILDRGLPAIEGLDVLGRIRSKGVTIPVLVLSARSNPADRVAGLDAGAEDYLGKPFDVDELLARLRGLLRRHTDSAEMVRVPGGVLDCVSRRVRLHDGRLVPLTVTEAELMMILARRPERVFSRAELPSSVETYVTYVRGKLGKDVIETIRGVGYRLGPLP